MDTFDLTEAMRAECQQLEQWQGLTEQRLDARKALRPYRQKAARKGVETKRGRL